MELKDFLSKVSKELDCKVTASYVIAVSWVIGGKTGGSCWKSQEETRYDPIDAEPEPELEELDRVLSAVCPNITFLQYKVLVSEVVERGEKRRNDYYGNYTVEAFKEVKIVKLYEYLKEAGIL